MRKTVLSPRFPATLAQPFVVDGVARSRRVELIDAVEPDQGYGVPELGRRPRLEFETPLQQVAGGATPCEHSYPEAVDQRVREEVRLPFRAQHTQPRVSMFQRLLRIH